MIGRFWSTSGQLVLALAFVLSLAFAASIALTLAKFSEALFDTVSARFDIHASDLQREIETGINLGLNVSEIAGNIEVIVRSRLALDEGIAEIIVEATDGTAVLSMGRAHIGSAAPAEGTRLAERTLPINNSFGSEEGTITVVYVAGANDALIRDTAQLLLRDLLVTAAAATAIATLACAILMAPLLRSMTHARKTLQMAQTEDPEAASSAAAALSTSSVLETAARDAIRSSTGTLAEIARIEARIDSAAGERPS